jgi:hypothetical protein
MNFTGRIERLKFSEAKKMTEIVIETAETRPQFLILVYFVRDGKEFPELKVKDLIFATAELRGRRWADPETGELFYFMSLSCSKIIVIKKGGNNEE